LGGTERCRGGKPGAAERRRGVGCWPERSIASRPAVTVRRGLIKMGAYKEMRMSDDVRTEEEVGVHSQGRPRRNLKGDTNFSKGYDCRVVPGIRHQKTKKVHCSRSMVNCVRWNSQVV